MAGCTLCAERVVRWFQLTSIAMEDYRLAKQAAGGQNQDVSASAGLQLFFGWR